MNAYSRKAFLGYLKIALDNAERTELQCPWLGSKSRPQSTEWPIPTAKAWEWHCKLLGI